MEWTSTEEWIFVERIYIVNCNRKVHFAVEASVLKNKRRTPTLCAKLLGDQWVSSTSSNILLMPAFL